MAPFQKLGIQDRSAIETSFGNNDVFLGTNASHNGRLVGLKVRVLVLISLGHQRRGVGIMGSPPDTVLLSPV